MTIKEYRNKEIVFNADTGKCLTYKDKFVSAHIEIGDAIFLGYYFRTGRQGVSIKFNDLQDAKRHFENCVEEELTKVEGWFSV